jgi:hypothetical protein
MRWIRFELVIDSEQGRSEGGGDVGSQVGASEGRFWDGYQERLDLCAIDGQVRLLERLVFWGSVVGKCVGDCGVSQLWGR